MNKVIPYKVRVIRSSRKTMALQILADGEILVRAPYDINEKEIAEFVNKNSSWIEKHLKTAAETNREESEPRFTIDEIREMAEKALNVIPERVEYYAKLIGVTYGRITIRNQKTRWGSCSSKGNLNFNCLLMCTPPEVIDSVVVHELCHRKHMNHSKAFYAEIKKVYPEYEKWNTWLKTNGSTLIRRMTG